MFDSKDLLGNRRGRNVELKFVLTFVMKCAQNNLVMCNITNLNRRFDDIFLII